MFLRWGIRRRLIGEANDTLMMLTTFLSMLTPPPIGLERHYHSRFNAIIVRLGCEKSARPHRHFASLLLPNAAEIGIVRH